MMTLRIYDDRNGVLGLDLRDIIDLLAPRSLEASWMVSPVTLNDPQVGFSLHELMIAGDDPCSAARLEQFAASGSSIDGMTISAAAHAMSQVIWGEFTATLPGHDEVWVVIRAIDSTFYEVTSADQRVHDAIRASCSDVRVAPGPVRSAPIEPV